MSKIKNNIVLSWLSVKRDIKINAVMFWLVSVFICLCSICSVLSINFENTFVIGSGAETFNELYNGKEYHYHIIETGLRIIEILNVVSHIFLFLSVLTLIIKRVITEEHNYIFMRCLGYKTKDISLIIFMNYIFLLFISSSTGFLVSFFINKLCLSMLKQYLFTYIVFNITDCIVTEIILFMVSVLVSFLFYFRTNKKPVPQLLGGKL